MSEALTVGSLRQVLKFPFQGPNWQNRFLAGSGLILAGMAVPIVPLLFVYGYMLRVMRQTIEGQEPTLPDWEDWGRLLVDGLRMMVAGWVYMLPGSIVWFGGMALYFASSFGIIILSSTAEGGEPSPLFALIMLGSMAVMFLSMALGTLLTVLGAIPAPVATAHFVARDKLAAVFAVREWWPLLRANKLGYLVAWIVTAGLGAIWYVLLMVLYMSAVLCCLIPIVGAPLGFYLMLVGAALFGHTYHESVHLSTAAAPQPQGSPAQE